MALNASNFSKVVTVVDPSIASSSSFFALHALSSSSTAFLTGKEVFAYLKSLETDDTKLQEIDLADGAAPAASKPAAKEKEDGKIEGALKIAIGYKKEVDFPNWYTNVSFHTVLKSSRRLMSWLGSYQVRHAGLLQRQWMLHPEAVVVQYLGNNPA